jgi:hypothetical protein
MNEIKRYYVMQQVEDKKMTGVEACQHLGLSLRQVRRSRRLDHIKYSAKPVKA